MPQYVKLYFNYQNVQNVNDHNGLTNKHCIFISQLQLMEDLVIGMNGEHAPLSVEVEIKQHPDDVTTLFLNLVVWSVRETIQIANVVIWIHALQHVLLR